MIKWTKFVFARNAHIPVTKQEALRPVVEHAKNMGLCHLNRACFGRCESYLAADPQGGGLAAI